MDKDIMNKLMDNLYDSIPEDLYVIKEVDFNSDVINNEHCIFFPAHGNMFTLIRYPADGKKLSICIRDAIKMFDRDFCFRPSFVLIPFNVYGAYVTREPLFPNDFPEPSLEYVCKEFGLEYKVMIPERLKGKVSGVIK